MPFAKYLRQHSCPIRRKKPRETSSDFSTLHTVHELQTPKQLDPHWLKFCSARRNTKVGFRSLHCGWSCIFQASLLDGIYQFHKDPVTPKLFIKHNHPPPVSPPPSNLAVQQQLQVWVLFVGSSALKQVPVVFSSLRLMVLHYQEALNDAHCDSNQINML